MLAAYLFTYWTEVGCKSVYNMVNWCEFQTKPFDEIFKHEWMYSGWNENFQTIKKFRIECNFAENLLIRLAPGLGPLHKHSAQFYICLFLSILIGSSIFSRSECL